MSGAKVQQVPDLFSQELEDPTVSQIIVHIGTNSVGETSMEHLNEDFENLALWLREKCNRVVFSSIIERYDKPELNPKINSINQSLHELCCRLELGFIDNSNINSSHLARDGLHINRSGQSKLAANVLDFLSQLTAKCSSQPNIGSSGNDQNLEILNDIDLSRLKSLKDQNPKNPFLCHLNINSLRHKIVDLGHVLNQIGIEIVAISETKLCSDFPDAQFQVDGYVYPPCRKDRTKHGGGIMVFVKNDLITKRKQEFESDSVEIVSLELTISRKKWIIFSFYRPPKSNIANFFSELSKCVDKATRHYKNVVLTGDINIDTSEEKAIGMTKLSKFCDIFDLVNLITGSTYETL